MSEYQRITSYLYEYINGVRGENVGFVRVETKDEQLKISFHMQNRKKLSPFTLYFYYYEQGKMYGLIWDEIKPVTESYEYKESFLLEEVFPKGKQLEDMNGIIFLHNDHHFLGSQWNDASINLRVFEPLTKQPPKIEELKEAIEQQIPKEELDVAITASIPDTEPTPVKKEKVPNLILSTDTTEKSHVYPQLTPYPTPDYSSCLKLQIDDLKDFPELPRDLSGNGFLRLQVQNYGYLFLGEKKLTNVRYIGIPGIFTNQRNFVAQLFGFPEFIPVPQREQNTGSFGYWIMTIDH